MSLNLNWLIILIGTPDIECRVRIPLPAMNLLFVELSSDEIKMMNDLLEDILPFCDKWINNAKKVLNVVLKDLVSI